MSNKCNPINARPQGEIAAGYPKFADNRVLVNAQSGFDGVSEGVWNFHIGGYQVAHKWLKDRRGRVLSEDDAAHYRRVLIALEQTIAQMQAIDEIIESHGGWPLGGSQDVAALSDEEVKSFFVARDAIEVELRPAKAVVGARPVLPASSLPNADNRVLDVVEKAQRTVCEACLAPTKSIDDTTRDELIEAILTATEKQIWHEREAVLVVAARGLGFARVGRRIRAAFASAFNGAIRRGLLEYEGSCVRKPS